MSLADNVDIVTDVKITYSTDLNFIIPIHQKGTEALHIENEIKRHVILYHPYPNIKF